jgi:hypothetical protein
VKYASAAAFRRALETRLLAQSLEGGVSLVRLRKSVVFDRLLARLLTVAPDRWLLKGGLALDYRLGRRARTTMDIDLAYSGDDAAVTADLLAAQDLDLGDHFSFRVERTARLDRLVEGSAVRYHVRADLAGRRFEEFLLDVGFDFPSGWAPETLHGQSLLAFADIDPVEIPSVSLEIQIAEKVHAYSRAYGRAVVASTRVKDLVDLVLISSEATPDAARLARALRETFDRRGRQPLPSRLPEPPTAWRLPYARMAAEVGLDPDLAHGHGFAAGLLDPILVGETGTARWDCSTRSWAR